MRTHKAHTTRWPTSGYFWSGHLPPTFKRAHLKCAAHVVTSRLPDHLYISMGSSSASMHYSRLRTVRLLTVFLLRGDASRGVHQGGRGAAIWKHHFPVNRMVHACEKFTSPILHMLAVIKASILMYSKNLVGVMLFLITTLFLKSQFWIIKCFWDYKTAIKSVYWIESYAHSAKCKQYWCGWSYMGSVGEMGLADALFPNNIEWHNLCNNDK